jgi:hypothetical protein
MRSGFNPHAEVLADKPIVENIKQIVILNPYPEMAIP